MRLNKLYELNGENLTLGANEFENLAKKVLTYTGESQKDYEKLIYDWASFIAKVYKIENAKLKFDKVLKNSGIRGCVSALEVVEGENIIHINPILMDKAPLTEGRNILMILSPAK